MELQLALALEEVKHLGCRLVLLESGQPTLRGDTTRVTPALVETLKHYRAEIAEMLRDRPFGEWCTPAREW